ARGDGAAEKIDGGFGHDNLHDGFAQAGAGGGAGGPIGVAAAADEGRIADAAGKFAAGAPGGGGGEEAAFLVERDGAYSALFVAAMMGGGMNGIADSADRGDGSGAKRTSVHDDGVAFDVAVEIEMRAIAGVEDRILFEDDDGGFDGVESGAARGENGPTGH